MGTSHNKNKNVIKVFEKLMKQEEEKAFAIFKDSIKDFVEEASIPVKEGGNMPVDTGFLRLSGTASINQIPSGEIRGRYRKPGETGVIYKSNPTSAITPMLVKLKTDDTFYFGWTAIYAKLRNAHYGFLDKTVQNWSKIVDRNKKKIKAGSFKTWSQRYK